MTQTVVSFFSAPPRTGKTYSEVKYLINEWLPNYRGNYYCNLELNLDAIVRYVLTKQKRRRFKSKLKPQTEDEIRARIRMIPREEQRAWCLEGKAWEEAGSPGPWSWLKLFEKDELNGCRIFIDEIHNFAKTRGTQAKRDLWQSFLGEVSHNQAQIVLASQTEGKVATYIRDHAEIRIELLNNQVIKDPWTGIPYDHLYELKAALTGEWRPAIRKVWRVQRGQRKWQEVSRETFYYEPYVFECFNSFSAPIQDDEEEAASHNVTFQRQYQRMGKMELLAWVVSSNLGTLLQRLLIVVVVILAAWAFKTGRIGDWFSYFLPDRIMGDAAEPEHQAKSADLEHQANSAHLEHQAGSADLEHQANSTELLERVERLQQQVEAMEGRSERLRQLVGIGRNWIVLRGGMIYRQGDIVMEGPLKGRRIVAVHLAARAVAIDGGEVLWLER